MIQGRKSKEDARHFREKIVSADGKVTWRVYVAGLCLAAGVFFSERYLPGWGRSIGVAVGVVATSTLAYRRLWYLVRFWFTMAALAALQVPFMIATKPLVDRWEYLFVVLLAFADYFAIMLAIIAIAPHDLNT